MLDEASMFVGNKAVVFIVPALARVLPAHLLPFQFSLYEFNGKVIKIQDAFQIVFGGVLKNEITSDLYDLPSDTYLSALKIETVQ